MPSHLHILYLGGRVGMKELMRGFKHWTGTQGNDILGRATLAARVGYVRVG